MYLPLGVVACAAGCMLALECCGVSYGHLRFGGLGGIGKDDGLSASTPFMTMCGGVSLFVCWTALLGCTTLWCYRAYKIMSRSSVPLARANNAYCVPLHILAWSLAAANPDYLSPALLVTTLYALKVYPR